jgi:hypothetical protein
VLYLERPQRQCAVARSQDRALRIQRLEGSRPDGRLCTLNGPEGVRICREAAGVGVIGGFAGRMER